MNLKTLQKATAYGVAGLGLLLLLISGELGAAGGIVVVAGAVGSWWCEEPLIASGRWHRAWNAATVAVFIALFLRWWLGLGFITAAVQFAAFLQLNKLFNRRGQADYDHVLTLALIHLIGATVLFTGIEYALVFVLFVVATPWLLMLGQIRREVEAKYLEKKDAESVYNFRRVLKSKRLLSGKLLVSTALLSIPVYAITLVIFLLFPRIGLGILAGSGLAARGSVGFSDTIALGDLVPLADNPLPVARVEFPGEVPDLAALKAVHWRATAYDTYDGAQWLRTLGFPGRPPASGDTTLLAGVLPPGPGETAAGYYRLDVTLRSIFPKVLLVPQETPWVEAIYQQPIRAIRRTFEWGPSDEVRFSDPGETGIGYAAFTAKGFAAGDPPAPFTALRRDAPGDLVPYLQAPSSVSRELDALAAKFAADHPDPLARARAIERWLSTRLSYSRDRFREVPEGRMPVDAFLFDWKEGNCEFFSTAMVLLLRRGGIPARNVAGFLGGEWNTIGNHFVVREGDAHSWVEAWLPTLGWRIFDPTPPAAAQQGPARGRLVTAILQLYDVAGLAWQKHVIAYDLSRQSRMMRAGYDWLMGASRGLKGMRGAARYRFDAPQKRILLVIAALALWAWAWSGRRREAALVPAAGRAQAVSAKKAASLLGAIDRRLDALGLSRPPARPPRAHGLLVAGRLRRPEVLMGAVGRYNEARFGGGFISPAEHRALVQSVKTLD